MTRKRKETPTTSAKGKAKSKPMAAAATPDKIEDIQVQLFPLDFERLSKVIKRKKESHEDEKKEAFKKLKSIYSEKKARKTAFHEWFTSYTKETFPEWCKVAYSVPHFYIGEHKLKEVMVGEEGTGAFEPKQESDLRAENAERKVFRAFKLLNDKMERNMDKESSDSTMFIMSNVNYENVLIHAKEAEKEMPGDSSDLCKFVPGDSKRKEADLIILHKKKGVIFVQVKAFGEFELADKEMKKKGREKKEETYQQLDNDEKNFKQLTNHLDRLADFEVHKVFALPNLSSEKARKLCGIEQKDPVLLLSKDDLFEEDNSKAESEYNLDRIQAWWNELPDKPLEEEGMQDIIGRYIGTLSKPRETNPNTERSHVRTVADAVALAARHQKTLCYTPCEDQALLTKYKRVHVTGPPGSGRTTLLFLKARKFLTSDKNHVVVVVDMNRGTNGRPAGLHIVSELENVTDIKGKHEKKVIHLPLDLSTNILPQTFEKKVNEKIRNVLPNYQNENVLFVLDEILPEARWSGILKAFEQKFHSSHVWCADSMVRHTFSSGTTFHNIKLSYIYRTPASVQRILFATDWDKERAETYIYDAGCLEKSQIMSTNGPTPVCIRHEHHDPQKKSKITDCGQCAIELAMVLEKMNMFPDSSGQSEVFLPCSISIVFGIPEDQYSSADEGEPYIEITKSKYTKYAKMIKECPFITKLKEELDHVKVTILTLPTESTKAFDSEESLKEIKVSWTDFFLGLERDVIIFLPGDMAKSVEPGTTRSGARFSPSPESDQHAEKSGTDQSSSPELQIPTSRHPQLPADQPGTSGQTSPSASVKPPSWFDRANQKIPMPGFANGPPGEKESPKKSEETKGVQGKPEETPMKHQERKSKKIKGLAGYYWTTADLKRFTPWDRSNLTCAATRCCAQLILMVP